MKAERLTEEIKSRLDMVEVLSDYVELKRAGHSYKGLCPFHAEKTPSFIVSPDKQIFHCFGCGAGGDIITFVMKHENLSFEEAKRLLAKRAGVKYETWEEKRGSGKGPDIKERIRKVLKESLSFFKENLGDSKKAMAYLKGRGITDASIEGFSLGYAPGGWHALHTHLAKKGFDEGVLLQAGVVSRGEKGIYDFMRERIIFPISSSDGELTAFGGRVMDDSMPKYLNSPDTILFKKSETLYGMHMAKEGIKKQDCAVIAEGYFDVIMCHQHGLSNAVAPLGTALAPEHLKRLGRITGKLLIVFDGDEAGVSAARRTIDKIAVERNLNIYNVKFLFTPEGQDPDSILKDKGVEEMRRLIENSVTAVDFLLKSYIGHKTDNVIELIKIISKVEDPIIRGELIRELADRGRINESDIREKMKIIIGRSKTDISRKTPQAKIPGRPHNEEFLLLGAILSSPDRAMDALSLINMEDLSETAVKEIFGKIHSLGGEFSLSGLLKEASQEEQAIITRLSLKPGFDMEAIDKTINDCLKKIKKRKVDKRIREAEESGDIRLLKSLLTERQRLNKETLYERTV
jgi:DNA primase